MADDRIIVGSNVGVSDGYLYASGWRDGHRYRRGTLRRLAYRYTDLRARRLAYLVRWPIGDAEAGRLDEPQWWTAAGRWTTDPLEAMALVDEAVTESTMHLDAERGLWFQVRTVERTRLIGRSHALRWARDVRRNNGMGVVRAYRSVGAAVALRWAGSVDGKWSKLVPCFAPPESARRDVLVYAAKAHPQLEGADLVCTYASGAWKMDRTLADESIYYPRFVRVTLAPR